MVQRRVVIPRFRVKVAYGSHMPVLINVMFKTTGPVLELGSGFFSTSFLHWICRHQRRRLLTCDDNQKFCEYLAPFASDIHELRWVENWDNFDLHAEPWEVAFLDPKPALSRGKLLRRLTHIDYVIVHDSDLKYYDKYGYTEELMKAYKYRYDYRRAFPKTSILSNKEDPRRLMA